jgi:hypothetical protein
MCLNLSSQSPSKYLRIQSVHFTITMINLSTPFREIITVNSENHTKPINTNEDLIIADGAGTYSYH